MLERQKVKNEASVMRNLHFMTKIKVCGADFASTCAVDTLDL